MPRNPQPAAPQNQCALCSQTITTFNDSEEHIIPQAIGGGRSTVQGFLCRECNNRSGRDWDAVLAKEVAPWSLLFGIKRNRGSLPAQEFQTLHGSSIKARTDGLQTPATPTVEETEQGYDVTAPSLKVARQILEGLKAKHPEQPWDVEQILANAKRMAPFTDMMKIEMQFSDAHAGRSIVKSALALAYHAGITPDSCELACEFLRHDNGTPCFDHYYGPDLVTNCKSRVPIHLVHIRGNPAQGTLMAYIEVFSLYRTVACLSRRYAGPELVRTHAVNPVTGQDIRAEINWHVALESPLPSPTRADYQRLVENVWIPTLEAARKKWGKRTSEYEIESAYKTALQNAGKKEGDPMTEEEWRQIARDIAHQIAPLYLAKFLTHCPNTLKGIIQIGDDPHFDPRSILNGTSSH